MGPRVLVTLVITLLMVGAVDIFMEWYRGFLKNRRVSPPLSVLIQRILFVLLAFLFWRALVGHQRTEEFASTHFFFTLFIYCLYRLIASYFKDRKEK